MGSQEFLNICKAKVAEYYNQKKDKTDTAPVMTVNDVFVVWYSKSLQNHKALLSTPVSDGMYYELTATKKSCTLMLIRSGKISVTPCNGRCDVATGRRGGILATSVQITMIICCTIIVLCWISKK